MDILFLVCAIVLIFLGIAGSFLPVLPGPLTSWAGLFLINFHSKVEQNPYFLWITFGIALAVFLLDYIIPAIGTKKFGGTKFGVIGTTIGLVLGLFFLPPIGLIVGPFVGAFVGEMIYDSKNPNKALKASYGSFIGFLTGTLLKFVVAVIFTGLYFSIFWEYKAAFFSF